MKIYYLVNARIPTEKAHGIQLAKMCEAMIEQGADLEIVVPARGHCLNVSEFYKLRTPVVLRRLWVVPTYGWGSPGFYLGTISFMISYLFYFWWKRLRGEKFIIYTSDIDQFSFSFMPFIGAKYFSEIHEAKKWRLTFVWFFKFISGAIVINEFIRNELVKTYGLEPQKIIIQPNGIDLAMFNISVSLGEARSKLKLPQGRKIALYVGQIYDWKGLGVLVEAAKNLPEGCDIYVVGGTAEGLAKTLNRGDIPGNLVCMGFRPYDEVPVWLAAADILILLGTRDNDYSFYSTSPMKLFEYMAGKRPIVAADTPAIRHIVGGGEVWFYEPDNAGTLAQKIGYILNHPDETKDKIERAFNLVKKYEWRARAKAILDLIRI